MHQSRRLQRLPRLLVRELRGGQLSQLFIHQRQELLRRLRIALLNLRQNVGSVGHGNEDSQPAAEMPENANDQASGRPQLADERVSKNVRIMPAAEKRFCRLRPQPPSFLKKA